MANSGDLKEIILKIDDRSNDGNTPASGGGVSADGVGKIWRDSSYDFWNDSDKIDSNWKKGNLNTSESFDFMQSKQATMEDPPCEFLHKQKASGDFSLDLDLEMDELQQEPSHHGGLLPTFAESPPSPLAGAIPRVSVRRRQSKGSPSPRREEIDGFVKCSSNSSSKRSEGGLWKSNLLIANKAKSRLMDPPRPDKAEPQSAKAGAGKSRQLMDDPLLEEDLPDEYKKYKLSALVLLEWLLFILIIAALVCSLTFPYLRDKRLWKLMLWRWEVLILVLICGRLVSGWIIRIIVFLIERNFLLRKRVLYFVYGVRKAVQNCLWLGLVLIAWHYLFDNKVQRETNSTFLRYVTKVLVCLLVGVMLWLVKILLVKVLASSFHVSTFFDRIQHSLFNQYVIETLSGPPLIEIQRVEEEEEEERIENEAMDLQIPPGLETSTFSSPLRGRPIGSGWIRRTPRGRSPMLSRVLSSGKEEKDDKGITIDYLHRLNPKNVSAWNMKRLMHIIRHGALSTIDEGIQDSAYEDGSVTQDRNKYEAKLAAREIFQNVAKPASRLIYLEDIERFLQEDEALKTLSRFEGSSESKRIDKKALKNWVVNAFRERRALALTLNDTKTAVNRLHRMVNVLVGIVILVIWLLILGIATSRVLVFFSSQLLLIAFIFGNTCKTVFEGIIFLFVMHPFDVGDRCEIDGVQMVVEEMNILTTVFLRFDNQMIITPNSVLATKAIHNYYRSPDMGEGVEFCIHVKTPAEKVDLMKQRILSYIEQKSNHWYPDPMIIFKELEELNQVRIAVWLTHRMNHQDMGERWTRRALLVEEMVKIFNDSDIKYQFFPLDINVRSMPSLTSDQPASNWTGPAS